jgi:cell division cycle protein 20 (cofactor of APC complex)
LAAEVEGSAFHSALASTLLPGEGGGSSESLSGSRVLAFKGKAPAPAEGHVNALSALYTHNKGATGVGRVKAYRHIPSAPERILDAPSLVDDYYLKLLDWSCANVLAVALGPTVYLWDASSGSISELCTLPSPDDYVTSVAWIKEGGTHLAVGTAGCDVQLWDCERSRQIRSMKGHTGRVGALDWNAHILTSGSRDASIFNHDVRIRDHHVSSMLGHTQEVCGLKWSPDGTLLASGGNDNVLCIWDGAGAGGGGDAGSQLAPRHTLTSHQAAVKALAWCPWQKGVLASGGGTADRCIKVWNASQGTLLSSTDTGSQVCSLAFNPHERELLSSHGFSQNQLCLWKFPTMSKIKELTGHTARVLHTAVAPDGSTVCSAGADETLRFWRCFGEAAGKAAEGAGGAGGAGGTLIPGLSIR